MHHQRAFKKWNGEHMTWQRIPLLLAYPRGENDSPEWEDRWTLRSGDRSLQFRTMRHTTTPFCKHPRMLHLLEPQAEGGDGFVPRCGTSE
ncbi:hypothetical protein CEXT_128461 [Caerostris extrusa]|uniref:Uncharacterized protein n=1 Tax=Caerostris extrusa TaxID=172846 RepID=A0AAV4S865_CAEEX|nr:hypothetical protein CEXT_128461 [Caerostris extrusa]